MAESGQARILSVEPDAEVSCMYKLQISLEGYFQFHFIYP